MKSKKASRKSNYDRIMDDIEKRRQESEQRHEQEMTKNIDKHRNEWKRRVEVKGPNIYHALHIDSDQPHFLVGYYDPAENVYETLHKRSPGGTIRGSFSRCRTHFMLGKAIKTAVERYGYAKVVNASAALGEQYRESPSPAFADSDPMLEYRIWTFTQRRR